MSFLWQSKPLLQEQSISLIRMMVGLLLIYHGQEVFQADLMKSYTEWDQFKGTYASLMVYTGKSAELISGISLFLGLFTRIGALICIGTLSYITFFVGHGQFWYGDQHPFMFVLFGVLYFFYGSGIWSLDRLFFKNSAN